MMKDKLNRNDLVHHYCLNHRLGKKNKFKINILPEKSDNLYTNFSELAYKHAMKKHIAFPTIDEKNNLIHGYYSKSSKRTSFLDEMMALKGGTSFRISSGVETR